uniref:Sidoreflexin n=1 Tax=Cacopsylla melanoneura TaxID=428564 RepID=A0A8D8UYJ1_9HEMI
MQILGYGSTTPEDRIAIDKPLFDLSTFSGRFKYFAWVTNPALCIVSDAELDRAKELRSQYLLKQEPPGTSKTDIITAKRLYESAFHPDTGEKQNLFGRMSFQVPGGMAVTGALLTFYKTTPQIIFWQWVNQSFNALVNYTNRNANAPLTTTQLGVAYVSATAAACFTAIQFKNFLAKRAGPFWQRYVPFAAVAAANCVNIPLMRQNEITNGVALFDPDGNHVGTTSKLAAVKGISIVVLSRILMCAPGMLVLPIIVEKLEKYRWYRTRAWFHAPFQTLGVGCFLMVMVPTACAIFPQQSSIAVPTLEKLEPETAEQIKARHKKLDAVYFNKGL